MGEILKPLLDAIPKQLHLPILIAVLVAYYIVPKLREAFSQRRYWDLKRQELELTKLAFEIEAIKKEKNLDHTSVVNLAELSREVESLRPDSLRDPELRMAPLKPAKRFLYGSLGALGLLVPLASIGMISEKDTKDWPYALLGLVMISAGVGAVTILFKRRQKSTMALIGAGLGFLLTMLIALFVPG